MSDNIVGKKFNKLTVLELDHIDKYYNKFYKCKCDCGNYTVVSMSKLKNGNTKSCGCARNGMGMLDLSGKKFGKLTAIKFLRRSNNQTYWECKCDCGNIIEVTQSHLQSGNTLSCGCLHKDMNMIGKRFGKLTVTGFSYIKNQRLWWHCKCDCGNEIDVCGIDLRANRKKSCGCGCRNPNAKSRKRKDLTGLVFGDLTVLYKCDEDGDYWHCRCSCGNEKDFYRYRLTAKSDSNSVRHCGCKTVRKKPIYKFSMNRIKDITNERFGRLVALDYDSELKKWHCKCDCGNDVYVSLNSLCNSNTRSCGCIRNDKVNIEGERFGKLKVIELAYKKNGSRRFYKCKCDCGNEIIVDISHLKSGHTKSCGCLDIAHIGSSAENDIIQFIYNKFPNLNIERHNKNVLGGKEIDIYIPEKKLGIEYNGSAFHASENGIYSNKDKYYHRDKFLLARENGIHLVTIFDIDYINNKYKVLEIIRHLLSGNKSFFIPQNFVEYTNNDYDTGEWLKKYGYTEVGQLEPENFKYGRFTVYRCGKTKWILNKEEFLDGKSSI